MERQVTTVWDGAMTLGEGPAWDAVARRLWFVDIKACRLHRLDPATGAVETWVAPAEIGWALPEQGGGLITGLRTGLAHFDPASGSFAHVAEVEPDRPGNRLNDACVGPDGSIWFGSMDDAEAEASGCFYRFDGHRVARAALPPAVVTNGPAVSPDGGTLYRVETIAGVIHAATIAADGTVGGSRVFAVIDAADGFPDGVTVDAGGNVWVGLWGGGCARRYAPDGALLDEVRLPASRVTKLALGGDDLRTAYVTTARIGLEPAMLEAQPLAGALFAFRVDVPGQAFPPARLVR